VRLEGLGKLKNPTHLGLEPLELEEGRKIPEARGLSAEKLGILIRF
jgi:hypothetical protein